MIRYLLITASAIAFAGATLPVAAADLSRAPAMPMAYPTYNWTGVYLGLNGGGGWGSQDPLNIITDRFDRFNVRISGGMFGGTAGAQVQVSHVVLGVESDLDWTDISGSGAVAPSRLGVLLGSTLNMSTKIDWVGTARARAGYAQDNWLFYATGGVALADAKTNLTAVTGPLCSTIGQPVCSASSRKAGAALGVGVEYGLTPNLSAKLEYMYIAAASAEIAKIDTIRAGLNYRFGGN
jgi:outer membrane immunogenic protein